MPGNRTLYHESIEILQLDGTQMCKLNKPYFEKDDVVELVRRLLQYSENFIVVGYQEGRREAKIQDAIDFVNKMEKKNKNWKRKSDLDPVKLQKRKDDD